MVVIIQENSKFFPDFRLSKQGQDEVIIFLHGLGGSKKDWQKQIDFFKSNYCCVAIELKGHGDNKSAAPFDVENLALDVIKSINSLQIKSFHLVGFSLGGIVAFEIASRIPNSLKSLCIVNALPEFKLSGFNQYWLFYSRLLLVKFCGLAFFAKILAKKLFPKKEQEILRVNLIAALKQADKKTYLSILKSLNGWSVADKLHLIKCRSLFISSEFDYLNFSLKKLFAWKIGAKIVQIKDARHAVPIESPEEFNGVLKEFLDG